MEDQIQIETLTLRRQYGRIDNSHNSVVAKGMMNIATTMEVFFLPDNRESSIHSCWDAAALGRIGETPKTFLSVSSTVLIPSASSPNVMG
jgi:hypothetical protein